MSEINDHTNQFKVPGEQKPRGINSDKIVGDALSEALQYAERKHPVNPNNFDPRRVEAVGAGAIAITEPNAIVFNNDLLPGPEALKGLGARIVWMRKSELPNSDQ